MLILSTAFDTKDNENCNDPIEDIFFSKTINQLPLCHVFSCMHQKLNI
jgi:hypothetical protein